MRYETNDYVALIMERINGITLCEYLNMKRDNNIHITTKIITSLYEAAIGLHTSGYVHGDLHGKNIIVLNDYKIKLVGFGQSDLVNSMSASDENIPNIYGDYLYLKYYIALLIFPKLEQSSIAMTIKNIRNLTIKDVLEYDQFPELSNKLYNILNSFPKAIEDDIDD